MIDGVGVGGVAEGGVPIVPGIGHGSGEGATDILQLQVLGGERCVSVGSEGVEVSVLAAEVDASVGDGDRGGDGASEGGLEAPSVGIAREGDYVEAAVESAVDGLVGQEDGGVDGGISAEAFGLGRLAGVGGMAAESEAFFGPATVYVVAADADGREA